MQDYNMRLSKKISQIEDLAEAQRLLSKVKEQLFQIKDFVEFDARKTVSNSTARCGALYMLRQACHYLSRASSDLDIWRSKDSKDSVERTK